MRFAEVFLRLGSALVGWMMMYAYFLWLAAVYAMGCGPDGNEMHALLLGMAPFICGFAVVTGVTRPFGEIHRLLRWLALPLALLLPFVVRSIWQVIQTVNIGGSSVCVDAAPALWQLLWAPTHIATVALVSVLLARAWRGGKEIDRSD